jgi:hypothetical protein
VNKGVIYLFITIGSVLGSYIPVLWHAGIFSAASIIGGFIGALAGLWAAIKFGDYINP